jgi:hypothetical protein
VTILAVFAVLVVVLLLWPWRGGVVGTGVVMGVAAGLCVGRRRVAG